MGVSKVESQRRKRGKDKRERKRNEHEMRASGSSETCTLILEERQLTTVVNSTV